MQNSFLCIADGDEKDSELRVARVLLLFGIEL